jgi:hypothetical protein
MDAALIISGSLGLLAAAVHGVGGEIWVVRKLSPAELPSTRLGGSRLTKAMIHASWHITTVGFLASAVALLLAGSSVDGDAARALAALGAASFSGFAAVVVASGAGDTRSLKPFLTHPGPVILTATAALAWWGTLSI